MEVVDLERLKKELENKLALEENLEKTHELSLTKIIKLKKKSHAKNIARNKTNEYIKKIKNKSSHTA